MYWPVEGQVVRRSSGDSQVRVKSQKYSEPDIDGGYDILVFFCWEAEVIMH